MPTSPRVALITGANKGIGLETARQLAQQGITVIIGARDAKRGETAVQLLKQEKLTAHCVPLDVTDAASITSAVAQVKQRFGHLDILINNAGILDYNADSGPETTSIETFKRVFDTNFFAVVAVTQAFLPLLKQSPAGRIVNLSSILGSIGEHSDANSAIFSMRFPAYDASKAAINMYTVELALTLKGTPIKVNAAHPGWVKTDMGGPQAPTEISDGAKTSVTLATLPAEGPTGGYFHMGMHLRW